MSEPTSRTWVWRFDTPPESIWRILADTARFNEAAELPKQDIDETPRSDGSVVYRARARLGPFTLRWEEKPVNWVHAQWFEHCRYFEGSPFEYLCARLRLMPEGAGCRCEYTAEVSPRNWLGRTMLRAGFLSQVGRTFAPLAKSAGDCALGRRDTPFDCKPPRLAPGARARVGELAEKIEATPHGHGLAAALGDYVLERQEVDLWSIRPLALARQWRVPERHAIELCLQAVKEGLLGLRWDLLCPRCQVAKASALALDQLPRGAHCPTCNIDYTREYSDNVELAFHPAHAIRAIESGEYCLFGPISTPHIKLQLTLAPQQSRALEVELAPGLYRARTLEPGPEQSFEWRGEGFPRVSVEDGEVAIGPPDEAGMVRLENHTQTSLTVIVEERAWARDALTAKRVFSLQAFRDLFDEDVLRPGDHVEVDHVSIMFTDLKGSTALYERVGDPQAYALVREHFAILGKAVRQHNGAIVKTIGDAIMASFDNPLDAFECALEIQDDFDAYNRTSAREPAIIKVGLHAGRCLSVTLNNRLDYYGTAANKAARLQGQSEGGDIVMSPEFAADPAIAARVSSLDPREEQVALKGFDAPVRFVRIPEVSLDRDRRGRA